MPLPDTASLSSINNAATTVLVTGAAGLTGSELVRQLLDEGYTVKAAYNKTQLNIPAHSNLVPVLLDLLDVVQLEEVMKGVHQLYHCAGFVSFIPGKKHQLFKINVEATANVVNAAVEAGVAKMVHMSSVAALGRIRKDATVNETMQWTETTSNSVYAQSKYLGELEVWRGTAEGLPMVIVNPAVILGAGNWEEGSTAIFKSVHDEFPWYAEGVTGFVDVRDVARAMILLMQSNIVAEKFILSAANASYKEVFFEMADAFGKKRPYKKVTPFLASIVWRLEKLKTLFTGKDPLVTKETARTALAVTHFDNSRLLVALPGFSYKNLNETISETCVALQQKINNR